MFSLGTIKAMNAAQVPPSKEVREQLRAAVQQVSILRRVLKVSEHAERLKKREGKA